jgi:hypothetical protein
MLGELEDVAQHRLPRAAQADGRDRHEVVLDPDTTAHAIALLTRPISTTTSTIRNAVPSTRRVVESWANAKRSRHSS